MLVRSGLIVAKVLILLQPPTTRPVQKFQSRHPQRLGLLIFHIELLLVQNWSTGIINAISTGNSKTKILKSKNDLMFRDNLSLDIDLMFSS